MSTLQEELGTVLKKHRVQRALLYGSVARGEEQATSDVDLFVQVATRFEKESVEDLLSTISARFALRFGNALSPLVLEERRVRHPANPGLIDRLLREGIEVRT